MTPDDVLQHKLVIEDVQHSDIGSYLCQLSTAHRVEDSQEAWLQVDFRKGKCQTSKVFNQHFKSYS